MNSVNNTQQILPATLNGLTSMVVMSGTALALGVVVVAAIIEAAAPVVAMLPQMISVIV